MIGGELRHILRAQENDEAELDSIEVRDTADRQQGRECIRESVSQVLNTYTQLEKYAGSDDASEVALRLILNCPNHLLYRETSAISESMINKCYVLLHTSSFMTG